MSRRPDVNRRSFLKASGVAATGAVIGLSGCVGTGDDDDEFEEITITQGQFIETPDPNDHITSPYYNIFDHVYEPLFTITPDIELEPGIVTEWEPTADRGATDLTIREDVVFHNGDDMTASDVAFTMNRIIDPEIGPDSDQAFGVPNITEAEVIDDTTVRLHHPDVSPLLAEFQYGQFIRVVNEDWLDEVEIDEDTGGITGPDGPEAFNGTGPYEVVEYEPDERIVMEHFDDYWGDLPPIEEITWNEDSDHGGRVDALQAGETNLIDNVQPDDVDSVIDDDLDLRTETSLRSLFLVMKEGHPPFDSKEFRQAMNYAVDNEEIIETVLNGFGEPMTQMHAEEVFGYNPDLDPYPEDLDQAEQLVDDSGYAGESIELAVGPGRYLQDEAVAETCVDMIDRLDNVDCSINITEFPRVSDANSAGIDGDPDMPFFLIGWGVITGDANYGISPWIQPEGGLEVIRRPDIWERLQDSQVEEDIDEREQMLQEINADLREEAPFVFLHNQESIYGVDQDLTWEPRADESIFAWEME